jgi:hypothetical protein
MISDIWQLARKATAAKRITNDFFIVLSSLEWFNLLEQVEREAGSRSEIFGGTTVACTDNGLRTYDGNLCKRTGISAFLHLLLSISE